MFLYFYLPEIGYLSFYTIPYLLCCMSGLRLDASKFSFVAFSLEPCIIYWRIALVVFPLHRETGW